MHKVKWVACLCKGHKQEIKEFSAKTKDIKAMANWLEENKCENGSDGIDFCLLEAPC